MTTARDIVIVGGGVIGLSAAYHLARNGVANVLLLDKGKVGEGASSRAGGIITGHLWSETGVAARKISLRRFRELSDELRDHGYEYRAVGCLNLFSPDDWRERERLLPLYDELDAPYEIIDAAEIRYRWKLLTPREDAIGLYDPLGGYSEPDEYLPALARGCRDLGVDIREGATVSEFVIERGKLRGLVADGELLPADQAICAVHSWTNRLLAPAGKRMPIKSFAHQRYLTAPLEHAPNLPAVNANPYGAYLRPALGDRILVGGETEDRHEIESPPMDFHMDSLSAPAGFSESLRERARPLLPALERLPLVEERVGLIAFTFDGEPILGAAPGVSGLWLGAAFHSGGFAYNPVAGMLLAQLAATGETDLDIAAFSPSRFRAEETGSYLRRKLRQAQAVPRRH